MQARAQTFINRTVRLLAWRCVDTVFDVVCDTACDVVYENVLLPMQKNILPSVIGNLVPHIRGCKVDSLTKFHYSREYFSKTIVNSVAVNIT
jgi:hypothetical protein